MKEATRVTFDEKKVELTEEERASFDGDYHFKVVAELRSDLTDKERNFAECVIEDYKERFNIINIDKITYRKHSPISDEYGDFGAVSLFFYELEYDIKEYLSRLEYYDFASSYKKVAV